MRRCSACVSAAEKTAIVRMPNRLAVRAMRQAISPRLAMRTELNITDVLAERSRALNSLGARRRTGARVWQRRCQLHWRRSGGRRPGLRSGPWWRRWHGFRPDRIDRGRGGGLAGHRSCGRTGCLLSRMPRRWRSRRAWGWVRRGSSRDTRQDRPGRLRIHDAHRWDGGGAGKVDIDHLARSRPVGRSRRRRRSLRALGDWPIGSRTPNRCVALYIPIEDLGVQVGTHAVRVAEKRERLAILASATVADRKYVGDKAEAVGFERAAQWRQRLVDVSAPALCVSGDARE